MSKDLIFIGFVCVFLLHACNNSSQPQVQETKTNEVFSLISQDDVDKIKYTDYILDAKTKSTIEQWQKYTELEEVIIEVKKGDFSFFIENSDILIALLKDLKETTPEKINTRAIQARLIALETIFLKFEDQLMRANATKPELLEVLKEVLKSFSNLNLQINKKFEKDGQNIQKPQ